MENNRKKEFEQEISIKIAQYNGFISQLKKAVKISAVFGGKVFNKNLIELLANEIPKLNVSYHKNYYGGSNFEFSMTSYLHPSNEYSASGVTIFWTHNAKEGDRAIIDGRKFNHEKFSALAKEKIDEFGESIDKLKSELADGYEQIEKYNSLIKQAKEIAQNFSYDLKNIGESKFLFESTSYLMRR